MLVSTNPKASFGQPAILAADPQIMWPEGDGPVCTGELVVNPRATHLAQPVIVVSDDEDATPGAPAVVSDLRHGQRPPHTAESAWLTTSPDLPHGAM